MDWECIPGKEGQLARGESFSGIFIFTTPVEAVMERVLTASF